MTDPDVRKRILYAIFGPFPLEDPAGPLPKGSQGLEHYMGLIAAEVDAIDAAGYADASEAIDYIKARRAERRADIFAANGLTVPRQAAQEPRPSTPAPTPPATKAANTAALLAGLSFKFTNEEGTQ